MSFPDYWLLATTLSFILFIPMPYLTARIPMVSWTNLIVCLLLAAMFGWVLWPFQILRAFWRR